jgi:hypothetical protein
MLAGRRMLIVLDDARDSRQARLLLPGGPGCLVIITSRWQLTGLAAAECAHLLTLNALDPASARQMLATRLDALRVEAEPQALPELAELCARLPMTLAAVAAQAAARPGLPLSTLAAELRAATSRMDGHAVRAQATAGRLSRSGLDEPTELGFMVLDALAAVCLPTQSSVAIPVVDRPGLAVNSCR